MQCPNCGLLNPPDGQRCDCGYDFPTGVIERPLFPSPSRNRFDSRQGKERRAFFIVPFVAAGMWYLVTLATLAVFNGRLRVRTDVLAMAIGAVTIGLVVAVLATLVLAVPLYWIVRHVSVVGLPSALAGGLAIGTLPTVIAWMLEDRLWTAFFSPAHGVACGLASAVVWWYLAGRPGSASSNNLVMKSVDR
jgi:hypothetical protein